VPALDRSRRRGLRPLPLAHTGRPAPFRLTSPAYAAALGGWAAAAVLLVLAAPALADGAVSGPRTVTAAHLVALVFFPFAVAAAVWQLLPVMLRNDPTRPWARWIALPLLAAGTPLALGVALDSAVLVASSAAALGTALVLLLAELASLVRRAPRRKRLVVSRPAVALAGVHAAIAFALGAVLFADGGAAPLGVPYERLLLVHLTVALVGWLTVMILAVGRTLVPMLGLAPAAPPRRAPLAELALVAGLWTLVAGLAWPADAVAALGILVMLAALAVPARRFLQVAQRGTTGWREGPVAHVAIGLVLLAQAAGLALAALAGLGEPRRAAIAAVVLLGLGWAVGVVAAHLGKLLSLSGWGSWPRGPRPKQAALYPRRGWRLELAAFALGVELLAAGVLVGASGLARAGAILLVVAALLAAGCGAETIRRVVTGRARSPG